MYEFHSYKTVAILFYSFLRLLYVKHRISENIGRIVRPTEGQSQMSPDSAPDGGPAWSLSSRESREAFILASGLLAAVLVAELRVVRVRIGMHDSEFFDMCFVFRYL